MPSARNGFHPTTSARLNNGACSSRTGRVGLTSSLDTAQNRTSFSSGTQATIALAISTGRPEETEIVLRSLGRSRQLPLGRRRSRLDIHDIQQPGATAAASDQAGSKLAEHFQSRTGDSHECAADAAKPTHATQCHYQAGKGLQTNVASWTRHTSQAPLLTAPMAVTRRHLLATCRLASWLACIYGGQQASMWHPLDGGERPLICSSAHPGSSSRESPRREPWTPDPV